MTGEDPDADPSFPGESTYLDPSSTITDLLEKKHQADLDFLRDDFMIRESALTSQLQMLETRALTAEQQIEDLRTELHRQEDESARSKSLANQFQKELIQSDYRYQTLLQKLFATFQCSRVEDVLACADEFRSQKVQIENLQKSLLEAQLLMSAEALKRTDLGVNPEAGNVRRLEEEVRALEKTVEMQRESLAEVTAARESEQREHTSAIQIKTREIEHLNAELKKQTDLNKGLVAQNVELRANSIDKRLQRIAYVARRTDPGFLGLERTSLLYPMYESISLLVQSIGDLDVEAPVIEQSLAKLREDVTVAASQMNGSQGTDAGELEDLRRQLEEAAAQQHELEEIKARLEEELEELRNDDKAPEVFALQMKVHDQAEQLKRMMEPARESLPPKGPRRQRPG
jgi:DNA repair exonuclease SbcCD ATPase subunit